MPSTKHVNISHGCVRFSVNAIVTSNLFYREFFVVFSGLSNSRLGCKEMKKPGLLFITICIPGSSLARESTNWGLSILVTGNKYQDGLLLTRSFMSSKTMYQAHTLNKRSENLNSMVSYKRFDQCQHQLTCQQDGGHFTGPHPWRRSYRPLVSDKRVPLPSYEAF